VTGPRIEAELKYLAADDRPLRRLAAMDRLGPADLGPASSTVELDRYLDTADLRLAAAGWACRLRTRDGTTTVSLKGPAEHGAKEALHRRPELEGAAGASLDPRTWDASEARAFLLSLTGGEALAERFRLEQERTERSVEVSGARIATLSLDRVLVLAAGDEVGRLCVVELEFEPGADLGEAASRLGGALTRVPGLDLDPLSKFEHAVAMLPGG
jgi:inorganic triphosphatase YgiF